MFTREAVISEVTVIVNDQNADDDEADGQRHSPGSRGNTTGQDVKGADHRGKTKEEEHEYLAQPMIPQRKRPTGVSHR